MPDIFDEIEATPAGDIFDQIAEQAPSQAITPEVMAQRPATPLETLAPMTASVAAQDATGNLVPRENPTLVNTTPSFVRPGVEAENRLGMTEQSRQQAQQSALKAGAIAAGVVAPAMLPAGVGAAATGGSLVARLGANALQGVVGGAASGGVMAAPKLAQGDVAGAAKDVAAEAAIGGVVGPVAGEVLPLAGRAVQGVRELLRSGDNRIGRAFTATMRPMQPSIGAIESQQARDLIADRTGVQVPPTGISEVLGNPKVAEEIKNSVPGAELSAEAIDEIKRQVVTAASGVRNLGMTAEGLSNGVLGTLRKQLGFVSKNSEDAVKALTNELQPKIMGAIDEVQNAAKALVPGTAATPTALGNAIRDAEKAAYAGFKATDKVNYDAVRSLPEVADLRVKPTSYNSVVEDFKANAPQQAVEVEQQFFDVVDSFGRPIPKPPGSETKPITSLLPAGTGKFAAPKLAPEQTLEQARQLRTLLGDSFTDETILPGLGNATKRRLYGALTEDIDRAIDELPTGSLKAALSKANAYHKENVGRFTGNDIEKVLNEFGEQGGAGPASIIDKLRSPDGPSFLARFESSAGKEGAPKVVQAVREYLYNDIGNKALNHLDGTVSVGKMAGEINSLPPEIRDRFFPQYKDVVKLAQREGAIKGLDPSKIAQNLEVDPVLLNEALTTKSPDVMKRLQVAVQESKKLSEELRGSVLGALAKNSAQQVTDSVSQNPIRFVRSITDGTFTPKETAKALDLIGRSDPKLLAQLQFNYVDDMLGSYATQRGISASNMAKDLAKGGPSIGPGTLRANTEAVLGADKTDGLLEVIQSLSKLESNQTKLTATTPLTEVLVKGAGGLLGEVAGRNLRIGPIGAANQAAWLFKEYRNAKYRLVAHMLTTPELRQLAMTPISQVSKDALNRAIRGTVASVAAVEGEESPTIDELDGIYAELNR